MPVAKLSPPVSIEDDLRPISLTSQIAKVMENFSLRSLMGEIRDKIDGKQFAMPGKSTTQALVYLLLVILAALDTGHCFVRLFFADFRKEFDFVDHNTLTDELLNLNVHPVIIRWIHPFLRIGGIALELVGVLHRGRRPMAIFRREQNLALYCLPS